MKFYFSLLFIFAFQPYRAQTNEILVLDSLNNTPISNVLFKTKEGNYYTNFVGKISLQTKSIDSIVISHPRYFSKVIGVSPLADTIFLNPEPEILAEFVISAKPKEVKAYEIGYFNIQNKFKNSRIMNDSLIVAVHIPNIESKVFIKKILLSMKAKKYVESYNVYLFESDSLNMPGKILYKQNIIVDSLKDEGVINIQALNIELPTGGIFVGLENFSIYENGNLPVLGNCVRYDYTEKFDGTKTYIFIQKKEITPVGFWVEDSEFAIKNLTPCFGLEVSK